MRLTNFSDYALRLLILPAAGPDELVAIGEVSNAYAISKNHLTKVAHFLSISGYLETVRGRGGGLRLAKDACEIRIGAVLRATEATTALGECFYSQNNCCVISAACGLKWAMFDAQCAFYSKLDQLSLADATQNPQQLQQCYKSSSVIS